MFRGILIELQSMIYLLFNFNLNLTRTKNIEEVNYILYSAV